MRRLLVVQQGKWQEDDEPCDCELRGPATEPRLANVDDDTLGCEDGGFVRNALPADVTAAFIAQATLATLKELIAIGEAANDEKDRRLMADAEPAHVSALAEQGPQSFVAPEPDFAGANVDVVRNLFIAQCEKDGRAGLVRRYKFALEDVVGGFGPLDPLVYEATCDGVKQAVQMLNLSALLEPPEAGSEEGKSDAG